MQKETVNTMAGSLNCDLCQQETAVLLQSNLGTGDTVAVGGHCLRTFYASALKAIDDALSAAEPPASAGDPSHGGDAGEPPAASTEPPTVHVAPMDTYSADAKALREADPDGSYPPGTHLHECPSGEPYVHKHEKGTRPHEHECTHGGTGATGA